VERDPQEFGHIAACVEGSPGESFWPRRVSMDFVYDRICGDTRTG